MRNKPQEYLTYNWLRKKGIKIRVLSAKYYPINYYVETGSRHYYLILKTLNTKFRLNIPDLIVAEDIFVLIYNRYENKYYLMPSFYFMVNSKKLQLQINKKIMIILKKIKECLQ